MRIGVLGTGRVGQTLATKLVEVGHEVKMGSRTADNESAAEWVQATGAGASQGTFADAAAFAELLFNCTSGDASIAALQAAGSENVEGKVLVDVSNALAFTEGVPFPTGLFVDTTESLAERIQGAFPGTRVVKTLNTMNTEVMVDPSKVPGARGMELYVDLWLRLFQTLGTPHLNIHVAR